MNENTPLPEVALMLPHATARLLLDHDVEIQERVLANIRTALCYWEADGYSLDPVTFEGVMNAFVAMAVPMHEGLRDLAGLVVAYSTCLAVDGGTT